MGLSEFQILGKLGEGSFSSVWKAKRISDGQEYAMKKVKMASLSSREKQNALNEVRILASINSPYIIGYKEAFLEDNSMTLYIVMEHAGGGDIYKKIIQHERSRTYFREEDIWNYAVQMILGLKTLHDMKILHRDLKSANVFLSRDVKSVKIGDLNVSKVTEKNLAYTQTGTPYYACPEIWKDQPYDAKSDIWSLGCVLYEMCALKPPFRGANMKDLYRRVQRGTFDRIPSQYSSGLNNFIALCLQVSPSSRPSCDKLLSHPMILKNCKAFIQDLEKIPESQELIGTIRLPRDIKTISQRLPKPKYDKVAQSEEFEIGQLRKLKDDEKVVRVRRSQRAHSQQAPRVVAKVQKAPVRVQSREKRVTEEDEDYSRRARKEREYLEKPKLLTEPVEESPERPGKIANVRLRNRKILHERKGTEPSEDYIERGRRFNNLIELEMENVDPNIRYGNLREKYDMLEERLFSNHDYLINKYLSPGNGYEDRYSNIRALERVYSNNDDYITRRAEDIVKKYYADAASMERREPLGEIRVGNERNSYLERYHNKYNGVEQSNNRYHGGYYQREYGNNNYEYRDYSSENNYINYNNPSYGRVQGLKGAARPGLWA